MYDAVSQWKPDGESWQKGNGLVLVEMDKMTACALTAALDEASRTTHQPQPAP
jgi:hypothetical protein